MYNNNNNNICIYIYIYIYIERERERERERRIYIEKKLRNWIKKTEIFNGGSKHMIADGWLIEVSNVSQYAIDYASDSLYALSLSSSTDRAMWSTKRKSAGGGAGVPPIVSEQRQEMFSGDCVPLRRSI